MKRKFLLILSLIALLGCILAISVSADGYGTDEEKLNKAVTITLKDGTQKEVHIYEMMQDSAHADFGKILAVTWYYDGEGKLAWGYTNELISVNSSGVASYSGINAKDVVVANFQCDVAHSDHAHGAIKGFGFKYWTKDTEPNTNLQYFYAPDTMTQIVRDFCRKCTALKHFDITENSQLTTIGVFAFHAASALESFYVPAGVTQLPNGEGAGYGTFHSCTSLEKVTFGSNEALTSVGNNTFRGCSKLTEITLPDSVKSVGHSCFRNSGIVNSPFTENSQCEKIEYWAFFEAKSLTNLFIPLNLTDLTSSNSGYGVIYNCPNLKSVTFHKDTQISYLPSLFLYGCSGLESFDIPETVTTMGSRVFLNCSSLTSIVIPNGVTQIGVRIFEGCTNLETVNMGASLSTLVTETDHFSLTYRAGVSTVYLPSTFTADSFVGGGKVTYVFTNPNTVFYYAGTQEQFDELSAFLGGKEGNDAFNTMPTVENGRLILIGECEAFYNNQHEETEIYAYANGFDQKGAQGVYCTRCGKETVTELEPIMVSLGYSVSTFDSEKIMVVSGFDINVDLLEKYEEENGVVLEISVMFAKASSVAESVPTSMDGITHYVDKGNTEAAYVYRVTFPAKNTEGYEEFANLEIVVSAFVYDGSSYDFVQGNDDRTVVSTLNSGFTSTTLSKILEICSVGE